jgi:peptidoglycan/xylan/chitin deacetylase (PgdA/CDA1 family)
MAAGATAGLAAAQLLPSVAAIGRLRVRLWPQLSGMPAGGRPDDHVALTFDDGPDPRSTPRFLDLLARLDVRATFFVLGAQLQVAPALGRRLVDEGHEVAVHGWRHTPHLLRTPAATARDLRRAFDLVRDVTGVVPRYWRPPHGIPTGAGLAAAHRLGLRPVLWTADGRDWQASATGEIIASRISAGLRGGAVVLLHDSDVTSAPGSWRNALDAVPQVVAACRDRDLRVGSLGAHLAA